MPNVDLITFLVTLAFWVSLSDALFKKEDLDVAASDAKSKWDQSASSLFHFNFEGEDVLTATGSTTLTTSTTTSTTVAPTSTTTVFTPTRRRRRKSRRRVEKAKSLTYIDNINNPSSTSTTPSTTTSTSTTTTASPAVREPYRGRQRRRYRKHEDEISMEKAFTLNPYLLAQELSSTGGSAETGPSLFEPFIHTSGYLLPPPFMTSPSMQPIPSLIPPTHPAYLLFLPKPPYNAPFDPLLLTEPSTTPLPSSTTTPSPKKENSSSQGPTLSSSLQNFLEALAASGFGTPNANFNYPSHESKSSKNKPSSGGVMRQVITMDDQDFSQSSPSSSHQSFMHDDQLEQLLSWLTSAYDIREDHSLFPQKK